MNLFLIGYRCTGKTTIGKAIAAALDWSFVDSDLHVVKDSGKSIQEIIAGQGWEAFRRLECAAIKQICKKDHQVVATGGGAVIDKANVRAMKTGGPVIWLGATPETIQKRMLLDKNSESFRPALTEKGRIEEIEELLVKRNPYYESASDFLIHTDDVPVAEIAGQIIQKIKDTIGE